MTRMNKLESFRPPIVVGGRLQPEPTTRDHADTAYGSRHSPGRREFIRHLSHFFFAALLAVTSAHAQEAPRFHARSRFWQRTAWWRRRRAGGHADRRRGPGEGRQRGRCRGRGRFRARRHVSAGRQPRRRRIHDRSTSRERNESSGDRLPRDRAAGGDARHFPRRQGRGGPGEVAQLGARGGRAGQVAGLALAHERYGSGKFTLAQSARTRHCARPRRAFRSRTISPMRCRATRARFARWPATAKIFLRPDGTALAPGELLVQPDLAAFARARSHATGRAVSTRARPPRRSPRACARPAAS